MFFTDLIKRRLASLLQPWLQQELDLELELGFLRSHAIAKNLSFDTSALNQLLDDSTRFSFKEVRVEQLILRVSNWSAPAFTFEVHGLHITLSVGEVEDRGVRPRRKPIDTSLEDMKKVLSEIDPEGTALHDAVKRISETTCSRSWTSSLLNSILAYCQLQIHGFHLLVQSPISNDSFSFSWEINELNADSRFLEHGCFPLGFISSLFVPSRESCFYIDIRGSEIGLKSNGRTSHIVPSTDLLASIKLKDFQLISLNFCVPQLDFLFSPADLSIILAINALSSKECRSPRNGRQLWAKAARRISSLMPTRKWSFYKVVYVVCRWLVYVHAFENLLLAVGYPVDNRIKGSVAKMLQDKQFSKSVKNQWKVISEMEKDLSVEAVALAWRVSRYRAVKVNLAKDSSNGALLVNIHFNVFRKILQVLAFICTTVCSVFMSIMRFLFLRSTFADYPKSNEFGVVYEDSCLQQCFSVNMGKIVITISPENAVQPPAGGKAILDSGISYSDLLSFCLSIDSFFLLYKENVCEQCMSFSCGRFKVISSSVMADLSNNYSSYRKGHRKKKVHESKTILWAEPAHIFNSAETIRSRATDDIEWTSLPFLDNLLREMWLNWKRTSSESEESKIWYLENPSILCEINSFLTDPALRSLSAGLWSCCLVVGKMNSVLEFSSILSIAILLRQIEHAVSCNDSSGRAKVTLLTPATSADPPAIDWHGKYNSYVIGIEMALHKILPDKLIQVGLFVDGPHVRVSLKSEELQGKSADLNSRHDDLHLAFDFRNIELAISPTLESEFASSSDAESEGTRLKNLEFIDIPKINNEVFRYQGKTSLSAWLKVHGLSAYLEDSLRNRRHQIVELNLTTVQLSSRREELRSIGTTSISFSAGLHGLSAGVTVLLFMDELFALVEVVGGMSSAVSHAFTVFGSFGGVKCQELITQEMVHADSENKGTLISGAPSLIFTSSVFVINCNTELKSLDIILHNARKSNNMEDFMIDVDAIRSMRKLSLHDLPDYGVSISVPQSLVEISFRQGKLEALTNVSGIRAIIFKYASEIERSSDQFGLSNMRLRSPIFLHEVSISDCVFALLLRSFHSNLFSGVGESAIEASTSGSKISHIVEDSSFTLDTEASRGQSSSSSPKSGFLQNMISPTSSNWILVTIAISEIYLGGCPVKDLVVGAHHSKKLESSVFIGKEGRTISHQMQGGSIFLETTAVVMFFQCFASYLGCISHLLSVAQSSKKHIVYARGEDIATLDDRLTQETQNIRSELWEKLEALTIDVSQFSLALVASDGSGRLQELLFGADVHLKYEVDDPREKFSFGLSNLSILSHILQENVEQKTSEIQISHISSPTPPNMSSQLTPENSVSQILNVSTQNYILKQLGASIAVEKYLQMDRVATLHPNQCWVGGGSILGFDMTISLPEIQMILIAVESLSGVFGKETTSNVEQRNWSSDQEPERSLEEIAPDGAIVALQDVHQHMYITVEGAENKYCLVGAIHYSLVGEKALFRVKYHYQSGWKSPVLWISLTSLHAKSDSGEPLRLNCRSGSGFVDISSSSDSKCALWKVLPYKVESYKDDAELESSSPVAKNTFYLVNRKNDRGIAFIDDGSLEFVSKPGNPFKWKVFLEESLPRDLVLLNKYSEEARTTIPHTSHSNEEGTLQTGGLSGINIAIGKLNVTIVHELSDRKEKFPLLQGSATFTEFIVQILYNKVRVMSKIGIVLLYFNAQRNLWEELVHPLEICIFYRSSFQIQGSEIVLRGAPLHFYARIKEVDVSVTELSVDILLFVIGKLNLAGPYAVRSSVILANCSKVENQTGLTLHCHFYDNKDVSVARNKSTTIFLRHLALLNQPPEASFLSIQLADKGSFSTSPIHLSLLEATEFAWRTRIVSSQDSKSYPGPTLVVEISQKTEDGLSIVVSPLLRIHNETDFSMELRFQRPQQTEPEFASVLLKAGDSIDDAMATFGAINLSGGMKKALMSLSVGNFLVSFRPELTDDLINLEKKLLLVEWSDDLKGEKAVRLSGLFDKLSYQVRKALSVESVKCSFSTSHCSLRSEDGHVADIHFLIQSIVRSVPIIPPDKSENPSENRNSLVAVQEQKEISLLPTVRVYNLLQSEIGVLLTDKDPSATVSWDKIGKQATVPCAASVNLYANPATIYFIVTLTELHLSCKPVDSSHWVKKLQKQKSDVHGLDIELDFGSGKYFAFLRLSRGHRGILQAAIFTSYTLKNDTEFRLFCFAPNQKPLSRDEAEKLGSTSPELGFLLPPKSTRSWFLKSNKVCLKLLEEKASEALLDLDALSGPTEIDLEVEGSGLKYITKLGVSLSPSVNDILVPAQTVSMNPRYFVFNESENAVIVRQCYLEDDTEGMIAINSQEKIALKLRSVTSKKRETSIFENFLRKHKNSRDDSLPFIQFRPNEGGLDWSGPVCVASLGRFFLKFRRSANFPLQESDLTAKDENIQFASVHVVEEGSSLVLHFHRPPKIKLPYRIENCLRNASISYYQKGSSEPEVLGSGSSVNYVWDDSTLPHKLVIKISDVNLLREINLNKVRAWKPVYRVRQSRGLGFHLPLEGKPGDQKRPNFGYEVYADGPTRVLRICEFSDSRKGDTVVHSNAKIRLRVSYSSVQLLEHAKQVIDRSGPSVYTPIIVMKLGNINLDSMFTDQYKFNQLRVQSLSVDEKWVGAPFAAMVRRHRSEYADPNESILNVVLVLLSSNSSVKQIKYSSIILQPLDLNLDEETLMRIVPFWRTSLSDPNTPSQQYYFDHFEIHPIKIIASFLPGDSFYSYSSTQETLRSLLHSVIKIPAIKNRTVELNGVLVTHALITIRELSLKCAQHYSWYAMRAVYIAKGSPLLPPAFASIFDDLASSSLDAFFDPSSGLISIPGLTKGTFKLISKCIDGRGFSGTKRYFGDMGKTLKTAGSSILFAAVTEISDSVLKGAETSGFNGMITGFHQGMLKLAMEPSVLGTALMEGGSDRKIKLDRNPGVDELYIEGYLQAMLDTIYKQEYLRVRVIDNQVILKNLPPNSSLIEEIIDRVKGFLVSKALLKGDSSRHVRPPGGESEWKIGPTILTLCEHLFVSFVIRMLRKQAGKVMGRVKWRGKLLTIDDDDDRNKAIVVAPTNEKQQEKVKFVWKWGIGKFVLSGIVAYIDGRLCRSIPNPIARRIVSGFLLSFLDKDDSD